MLRCPPPPPPRPHASPFSLPFLWSARAAPGRRTAGAGGGRRPSTLPACTTHAAISRSSTSATTRCAAWWRRACACVCPPTLPADRAARHPQKPHQRQGRSRHGCGPPPAQRCVARPLNQGGQYVNLVDILVDLKLTPDVLELPVPRCFGGVLRAARAAGRPTAMPTSKNNLPRPYDVDGDEDELDLGPPMTREQALQILQRNELGRQGRKRFRRIGYKRPAEEQGPPDGPRRRGGWRRGDDQHVAAAVPPTPHPRFLARRQTRRECARARLRPASPRRAAALAGPHLPHPRRRREEELVFSVWPAAGPSPRGRPCSEGRETKAARKFPQEHEKAFAEAHEDVREAPYEEEGPDMREDMMDVISSTVRGALHGAAACAELGRVRVQAGRADYKRVTRAVARRVPRRGGRRLQGVPRHPSARRWRRRKRPRGRTPRGRTPRKLTTTTARRRRSSSSTSSSSIYTRPPRTSCTCGCPKMRSITPCSSTTKRS